MTVPTPVNTYGVAVGSAPNANNVPFISPASPAPTNVIGPNGPFKIGQRWVNSATNQTWTLTSLQAASGSVTATWTAEGGISVSGVTSVTGTTNQVTASPTTGSVTVSLPSTIVTPGSLTVSTGGFRVNGGNASILGTDGEIGSIILGNPDSTGEIFISTGIGNFTLDGNGNTINIGTDANPSPINIGSSSSGQITFNAGSSGLFISGNGNAIGIGNDAAANTIDIGSTSADSTTIQSNNINIEADTILNLINDGGSIGIAIPSGDVFRFTNQGSKISFTAGGAAASIGTSAALGTLGAGTVQVNTTAVHTNSKIFLTYATPTGTLGSLSYGTIVDGVSFVITSSAAGADTSTVNWWILDVS